MWVGVCVWWFVGCVGVGVCGCCVLWCVGCVGFLCVLGVWVWFFLGFFFLRRNYVGLGMNFFFGLASDDDDDESGLAQGILKQTD